MRLVPTSSSSWLLRASSSSVDAIAYEARKMYAAVRTRFTGVRAPGDRILPLSPIPLSLLHRRAIPVTCLPRLQQKPESPRSR